MSFTSDSILIALELSNSLWLVGTRMPGAQKVIAHGVGKKVLRGDSRFDSPYRCRSDLALG